MGQARKKGSLEARKKQSLLRQRDLLPDSMTCNECGKITTEIIPLSLGNSKSAKDIKGVGFSVCPNCDRVTFGFDTTVQNVEKIQHFIENVDQEVLYPLLEQARIDFIKTVGDDALFMTKT